MYCLQLNELNYAIKQKRPELANREGIVFHHDNARSHSSLVTRKKMLKLGCDVLAHPPYSLDLMSSDYHLFRSLRNDLNSKNFTVDEDVKSYLEHFFANKEENL